VDVSDVQNCCLEDDLVSSIALLGFTLHRLKIIITQNPRPFHSVEEMFLFLTAVSHCFCYHGTAILRDLFD